jgi:hypothetical protein
LSGCLYLVAALPVYAYPLYTHLEISPFRSAIAAPGGRHPRAVVLSIFGNAALDVGFGGAVVAGCVLAEPMAQTGAFWLGLVFVYGHIGRGAGVD